MPERELGVDLEPGVAVRLTAGERPTWTVEEALRKHGYNISLAAAELGLSRAALYRRMEKHGL